jgi:hypothetical protein
VHGKFGDVFVFSLALRLLARIAVLNRGFNPAWDQANLNWHPNLAASVSAPDYRQCASGVSERGQSLSLRDRRWSYHEDHLGALCASARQCMVTSVKLVEIRDCS